MLEFHSVCAILECGLIVWLWTHMCIIVPITVFFSYPTAGSRVALAGPWERPTVAPSLKFHFKEAELIRPNAK